jgi:hypothetical protein
MIPLNSKIRKNVPQPVRLRGNPRSCFGSDKGRKVV